MQRIVLTFIGFFLFSQSSMLASNLESNESSSCSDVDLRTLNRLTEENRNQGKMDWCYAYAAADLVQYFYNTVPLSASNIAINYNDQNIAKIIHTINKIKGKIQKSDRDVRYLEPETGFIELALKNSFNYGFCPRDIMPDEKITRVDLINQQREEVDYEDAMFDILKNLKNNANNNFTYMYEFPLLDTKKTSEIISQNRGQKIFNVINSMTCNNSIVYLPKPQIIQKIRNRHIFKTIDQQLNAQNIVAIDYTAKVLRDKKQAHKITQWLHTSTLVGRRWNEQNNQCEYLVRNSAGENCQKYDPDYECDKGNIWVPQKYLHKSLLRVTYLK
jgi:hypothetical protein